jgi:phosphoribosylformylglycinamidine synthase
MKRYQILVTLRDGVKDIQGEAIVKAANTMPFVKNKIQDIIMGKVLYISCEDDLDVTQLCEKLLANTVIEKYEINEIYT